MSTETEASADESTTTVVLAFAANALIANNEKLFEKKLWSAFGDGEPVRVIVEYVPVEPARDEPSDSNEPDDGAA